jgi:hypothetical protein
MPAAGPSPGEGESHVRFRHRHQTQQLSGTIKALAAATAGGIVELRTVKERLARTLTVVVRT